MSADTSSSDGQTFTQGQYVFALWKGKGRDYIAFVEEVNSDNTYKLVYSDGDYDAAVLPQFMKPNPDQAAVDNFKCECGEESISWRRKCKKCGKGNPAKAVATSYGGFGWASNYDWHASSIKRAEDDARAFLEGYPGQADDKRANKNFLYFSNQLRMQPDGYTIEEFQKHWWGKYGALESGHSFVQWIFPIREQGLNPQAQPLQKWEAEAIAKDPVLQGRLITNYKLMLDFYGMKLLDEKTGQIGRNTNWEARYDNLERCTHNFLRITRILKCLAECGLAHYQAPFVEHVFKEIFEHQQLECCEQSARMYWVTVVKDEKKREELKAYALKFREIPKQAKTKGWGGHRMYDDDNNDFPEPMPKTQRTWESLDGLGAPLTEAEIDALPYGKGQKVLATWQTGKKLYKATIMAINKDGTYRLFYNDGDIDDYATSAKIQKIEGQEKPPKEQPKKEENGTNSSSNASSTSSSTSGNNGADSSSSSSGDVNGTNSSSSSASSSSSSSTSSSSSSTDNTNNAPVSNE